MISLETIEREIRELESKRDTSYAVCERLAWLYIVRDHLADDMPKDRTARMGGTEFLEACSSVGVVDLMSILDEHMSAIRVVYPKEYESVLAKIRALGRL